ncbi:MAG: hypothetical protein ACI843_002388 [Psychrobacter glaciei]|jgi:hypothetical protein
MTKTDFNPKSLTDILYGANLATLGKAVHLFKTWPVLTLRKVQKVVQYMAIMPDK